MGPKTKTLIWRALRLIGLVIFVLWYGLSQLTAWIGRSTVPEDSQVARDRLGQLVDWLLSTPGWVPGSLAAIFAVFLLFPRELAFAVNAMRGKDEPLGAPGPAKAAAPEALGEEYLGGGAPSPPRAEPETEHPEKQKAKEALVPLIEDHFAPADKALQAFKLSARDRFMARFSRSFLLRGVLVRAIDHAPQNPETRIDAAQAHELTQIDKVRTLSLYEMETSLYSAYIDYGQNARLAVELVNECEPMPESLVAALRQQYLNWRDAHDKFVSAQIELRRAHRDLNMVGRLHEHVLREIPEPDWRRVTNSTS